MKKLVNRALSIVLVFSLSAQASGDFWDTMNIGQLHDSTTGFQEFVGINGEKVYNIGGSLTLKRDTQNFPLWWNFQPPGIQASCSGISFKGMFGTIVNLDEIATQFEEAGASFAWGILVGVIYSLPGIGEIFTKLDAWAKKIQSMLSNSCNAGIAMGKQWGTQAQESVANDLKGTWAHESWSTYDSFMKSDEDMISKFLDCSDATWANMGSDVTCKDGKHSIQAKMGAAYLSAPSILASVLLSSYSKGDGWPTTVDAGKSGTIAWNNITSTQPQKADIAFAALIISVVGDVVMDKRSARAIIKYVEMMDNSTENAKVKKEVLGKATLAVNAFREHPTSIDSSVDIDDVCEFLIYGNNATIRASDSNVTAAATSSINLTESLLKGIQLPRVEFYAQEEINGQDGQLSALAIDDIFSNSSNQAIDADITNYLSNYTGVVQLAEEMKSCYLDGDTSSCAVARSALVDSDQIRYFAKIYRNTPASSQKKELANDYVAFAIYQMSYAVYYKIVEYISLMSQDIKYSTQLDDSNEDVTKSLQEISASHNLAREKVLKKLKEFKKSYKKTLIDNFPDIDSDLGDISRKFRIQDKENIRSAYGKNG